MGRHPEKTGCWGYISDEKPFSNFELWEFYVILYETVNNSWLLINSIDELVDPPIIPFFCFHRPSANHTECTWPSCLSVVQRATVRPYRIIQVDIAWSTREVYPMRQRDEVWRTNNGQKPSPVLCFVFGALCAGHRPYWARLRAHQLSRLITPARICTSACTFSLREAKAASDCLGVKPPASTS